MPLPTITFDALPQLILLVHLVATWAMVGLIAFVQVVHYPLFASVSPAAFEGYHAGHMRLTTRVVAPFMLVEAATTAYLVIAPPPGLGAWPWVGAALLAVVWGSTYGRQVPCHRRLSRGFDPAAARQLVISNRVRALAWGARGLVALVMAAIAG